MSGVETVWQRPRLPCRPKIQYNRHQLGIIWGIRVNPIRLALFGNFLIVASGEQMTLHHIRTTFAALAGVTICAGVAFAQTESVIHSFSLTNDGQSPGSELLLDASGTLYGTTSFSSEGEFNGTVFSLVPSGGSWNESVLAFVAGNPGGGLIEDSSGNLYGVTTNGGAVDAGSVYELSPSGGSWSMNVLYSFCDPKSCEQDGSYPVGELVPDASGNLYGVTESGGKKPKGCPQQGSSGAGTLYKLSSAGGSWTKSILYKFDKTIGCFPLGLHMDSTGAIFVTTSGGGAHNGGTVVELAKHGSKWTATVVHSFGKGTDGVTPNDGLDEDASGNLYGTTRAGGDDGDGVVFELSQVGGTWKETVLYSFAGAADGSRPLDGVHIDTAGVVRGTTVEGGTNNAGVAFTLTQSGGTWSEAVFHNFGSGSDGAGPWARLVEDGSGNLYGTTRGGGTSGIGTVFEITP
jgi:uncharacterized repeat protein (TIGR03803 family)